MKIHNHPQGSTEWLRARAGLLTASQADGILTPLFKARESKGVDTLIAKLLAERWIGGPLPEDEINTLPMEFGKILEIEAKPFYSCLTGEKITNVGFITNDERTAGCSPDGLIGDDAGIEIKSPQHTTHVKNLLSGKVPDEYLAQIHFSMWITGRTRWVFMSYRRGMPSAVVEVQRDESIQQKIADAVAAFLLRLQSNWARLVELNGGREPERTPTPDQLRAEENPDLIP